MGHIIGWLIKTMSIQKKHQYLLNQLIYVCNILGYLYLWSSLWVFS